MRDDLIPREAGPYAPVTFSYAATPAAVPYTADPKYPQTVDLMLTVNNTAPTHVDCSQIVFDILPGKGRGKLTSNPGSISCAPGLGVPWIIGSDGEGNFTAMPSPPATGLGSGGSIAFLLTGIEVNELPGLVEMQVWEQTTALGSGTIGVNKVPPGLAVTGFSAAPVQVASGGATTLSWMTTGASSCTLSFNGVVKQNLKPTDSYTDHPLTTTTYTLTAVGGGRTRTAQVTVYVPEVTIISFGASPADVAMDTTSTLTWLVNNADSVTISPGSYGILDPVRGSQKVTTHASGTYILSATGVGQQKSMPAPVNVMDVVATFSATPSQVPPGSNLPATLSWATQWATAVAIQPGIGTVGTTDQTSVSPAQTTTYTLQTTGQNPPPRTATVTVCPAIASVEVITDPDSALVYLVWQVVGGALTMTVAGQSPQPVPSSGSTSLSFPFPSEVTFSVSGVGMASTLVITLPGDLGGATVDSLKAICGYGINAPGASATLTWATTGGTVSGTAHAATSQSISGDSGQLTVPLGQGGSGQLWNLDFGFGDSQGHRIGIATALPTSAQ